MTEDEFVLTVCYSCEYFIHLMGEAGVCELNKNNCLCKNPKAMIDIFDKKCEKYKQKTTL